MARQRFIWPSMWTDKSFGSLSSDEKVLFISLFSLADDEGRISAEPMFLKAAAFPYDSMSAKKVTQVRDGVVAKMAHVRLYEANDEAYIALLKWAEYQKPKYAKDSKIPPPLTEDSGNVPGTLEERSPIGLGLDRVGFGLGLDSAPVGAHDPPPPLTVVRAMAPIVGYPENAQGLVAYFVDQSKVLADGATPPARVTGQVAKLVGEMLTEGQEPESIRLGLDVLISKRLHPSALPSCVHGASLPRPRMARPGRVTPSDILARAKELEAEEARFHDAG